MTQKPISVKAVAAPTIPVDLVGKNYVITPPKSIHALHIAQQAQNAGNDPAVLLDVILGWVRAAFTKKDAKAIEARLEDSEDLLDITHLTELVGAVIEHQTAGRPTT